ncbi:zinc finger, CCHC-type containing protein [Tanacetum coccineum]
MAAAAMSVVYVFTTPIPKDGMFDLLFDIYLNVESGKELWDSFKAKYMVDDALSKKFLHTLKHNKEELTLVELDSHMRIEESLKAHDSDKPKGKNIAGPQLNIVNDNIASAFMSTSKLNDSILWHARLGHVYFKRMQDMSKDELIPAFDMDTEKCKTCMLTKITKKPFQNIKHKTKVLELVQSDLCDLHATLSLGNKKYFMTFIDDASRNDRGGEYMDTLYFQSVGIIHEMTAPYTLQQNGISERKNRVLKEMVNSMWSYSGLSERGIECIFIGYVEHFKAFRFYVIKPNNSVSINSIIESRDVIFNENRLSSVPKLSLRIPNRIKDIGGSVVPEECFNVEDDPKIFDEAMKSQDVAFWKEAINNEMDSIMGNNTWVLADLPQVNLTKEFLSSKFSMKDMREADVILGIMIKHESNRIAISQSHYIEKVIGCLMYAMTYTRPDIAFAMGKLSRITVIMEYLVKISKKAPILELKRRHLKITVLTSNTPYRSRKIRHICACTSLKTTKDQGSVCRI